MLSAGRFGWISSALCVALLACGGTSATETGKDGKDGEEAKAKAAAKAKPEAKQAQPAPQPDAQPQRALPTTPATLADAATQATQLYADHRVSFYCGCSYTTDMRTVRQSCGYKTRADESLAHEIAWTHVVPARAFGAHRACWTTESCQRDDGTTFGGIECCRQRDPMFVRMENDLVNLVPEIAEVDKDRSDFPFGVIKGETRMYGACDIEVDGALELVEPPEKVRGDVARVYMYMRAVYGDELQVPAEQWALLEQWAGEDPPDEWEQQRAARVAELQKLAMPAMAVTPKPAPAPGQGAATPAPAGATPTPEPAKAEAPVKKRKPAKKQPAAPSGAAPSEAPPAEPQAG